MTRSGNSSRLRYCRGALSDGVLLVSFSLLAASCAAPVGVTRVDTQTSYRLLTSSAVASGQPSENAQRILRRYLLLDVFEKNPSEALAALHRAYVRDGGEDQLTALAPGTRSLPARSAPVMIQVRVPSRSS